MRGVQMDKNLLNQYPLIEEIANENEVVWLNTNVQSNYVNEVTVADIEEARKRLERFAPYFREVFPETTANGGLIESELIEIPLMKEALQKYSENELLGTLLLKCDSHLPISGSIKARGGIYEVLTIAEAIAVKAGILSWEDDYSILAEAKFHKLFSNFTIAVGSTGNLGLSIGIMSARLGFKVDVHMSSDAKQWKKDLLRNKGATVIEYNGNYETAISEGRKQAEQNPNCYFIDDENSKTLFLGYAVAAKRVAEQLNQNKIIVDNEHPLFVYLPCGVGGGPGGIAFGLKQIFGEQVHCFFVEPVAAPCMLLGVMTGLGNKISVQDIGLSGNTAADGLAVSRPSRLVCENVGPLLDGIVSVHDYRLYQYLADLANNEGLQIEPSAAAGFHGFLTIQNDQNYRMKLSQTALENGTHIVWATGGSMVPQQEMDQYRKMGERILD